MPHLFDGLKSTGWLASFAASALFLIVISAVALRSHRNSDPNTSLVSAQAHATPTRDESGIFRLLPPGAEIADERQNIVTADIDNDGRKEAMVFYSVKNHGVGVLVLKRNGANYDVLWQNSYADGFGFGAPTGVYRLNKNKSTQIAVYRLIGTSCPGVLEMYAFRNGKMESITGPWADKGQCHSAEIKDLDGDGSSEIIITSRMNGVNPDVYQWNGNQFVQQNARFAWYYNDKLSELIASIHSREALPASARVGWCQQAVKIYKLQANVAEGIQLCEFALRTIDDSNLTIPNSIIGPSVTTAERDRILAFFELEKIQGKRTIHQLLAELYKSVRNLSSADTEIEQARTLEAKAREMESELRRKYPISLSPAKQ